MALWRRLTTSRAEGAAIYASNLTSRQVVDHVAGEEPRR